MFSKIKKGISGILILSLSLWLLVSSPTANANTEQINQLNNQISEKQKKLEELDKEIAKQRAAIDVTSGRANNLQSNINQLEATRKKLLTDIEETENQIDKAELTLQKLDIEINDKEYLINQNSEALAQSIRLMNDLESVSLVEKFLGYETISDFWNDFEQTERIQKRLHTEVETLIDLHKDLQTKEVKKKEEKESLAQYKVELSGERVAVEYTKQEKATLLQQTKQEEAAYQKILDQKLSEREAFEKELFEIESQLQVLIDPDGYQQARKGVLGWPTTGFWISQNFGYTSFAAQNRQWYGQGFHNGTDFAVPTGTKIIAAADGIVKGVGNTDAFPGCRSWGKWIMLEHENGLSTMHAHLSSILVNPGQKVTRGETIGLSGSTGISTGPHLHFTLYITQGVKIRNYRDVRPAASGCGAYNVSIPMASLDAYLDPMDYLPSL